MAKQSVLLATFLILACVSACSVDNLFQQQASTSPDTAIASSEGDEDTDGAYVEYPSGLLPDGTEISIEEGESVATSSVADALQLDTEVQSVGTSVNIAASEDISDADAHRSGGSDLL